jgi:hypothetical protein
VPTIKLKTVTNTRGSLEKNQRMAQKLQSFPRK